METMKAGRELDALIAEQVMGWKDIRFGDEMTAAGVTGFAKPPGDGFRIAFPHYSTDIAAAWEVVEKLPYFITVQKNPNTMTKYDNAPNPERLKWNIKITGHAGAELYQFAETAPHAICLAALKAIT